LFFFITVCRLSLSLSLSSSGSEMSSRSITYRRTLTNGSRVGLIYLLIATTYSYDPIRTISNAFCSHKKCRRVRGTRATKLTLSPRSSAVPVSTTFSQRLLCEKSDTIIDRSEDDSKYPPFVIREIREEDIGVVAKILADSFLEISGRGNFFTKLIERMDVYLSLKSRFETFRYSDRTGSLQCFLVACSCSCSCGDNTMVIAGDGTNDDDEEIVIAICEIDNRPPGVEIDSAPRPFVSNLAVDAKFRRRGVATALVKKSENIVRGWDKPRLYLQVYDDNFAAKEVYTQKCGFEIQLNKMNAKKETILLLGKDLRI